MHVSANTLDDLLRKVFQQLLQQRKTFEIRPSKGPATELNGVLLELKNPRARLSRTEKKGTIFSCLGEFLWYLSGRDDLAFVEYYIPGYSKHAGTSPNVYGAYGPRLFKLNGNIDQVANVISALRKSSESRRAVIQLFHGRDLAKTLKKRLDDIPCTCTLQFSVRKNRLHLLVMMRSNDAFMGLPHDVFAFTMLQELIARSLENVEVGSYKHAVGSLHLYTENIQAAEEYIDEGFQEKVAMPPMPAGDQWTEVEKLLSVEAEIREKKPESSVEFEPYWADLVRLLRIYELSTVAPTREVKRKFVELKKAMHADLYATYILKREQRLDKQLFLFDRKTLDSQQASASHR
ncbi:thymidylate synthase [Pandoraea terrigena]|uniref:thymidylate synthase n=1 Tax=Pandoraea terrigena TaxID=2508292 RepID=A0A5E4RWT4_9BURK|nr:thymidylate synthase [Pandoraea terrigena]VVD66339.1 thymidylate synthase [Pandoraea terrigena]